jgi:hypothetical protein
VGSSLQWPALSVQSGYIDGLPVGLQILGRAWDEAKIVSYAYAYEQATHYRRPPATTPPLASSFAAKFIGTWRLIGITDRDPATQKETPSARGLSSGQLIYEPNGRLSVQIMTVDRSKVPAGSAEGFSSYFGRWELNPAEGCMVHIQDGNLNYAQLGQHAKRYYHFDSSGRLGLETPPRKRDDGTERSMVFWWEKI